MKDSALAAAYRTSSRLVPMSEGQPCGDAAGCFELNNHGSDGKLLAIIDGLGHGALAAKAARTALAVVSERVDRPLEELMEQLDDALRATRGAAVGLLRLNGDRAQHAGIGNTRLIRWRADRLDRCMSRPGIVGAGIAHPVQITHMNVEAGDWFLLFTDGIDERLELPARLPEWERDPLTLCDHLVQRWRTGVDDCGVLVLQVQERN